MRAFQGRAAASRLQEKGVFRKSSEMIGMTPVGNHTAGRIEDVSAFEGADEDGVEAWYDHVAEATADFCEGERITSTAREHVSYFANISEWCVTMGLPALCERADTIQYDVDVRSFGSDPPHAPRLRPARSRRCTVRTHTHFQLYAIA